MKMRMLWALLALLCVALCAGCLNTRISDSSASTSSFTITALYPKGDNGLFSENEDIEVVINGRNETDYNQSIQIQFVITDFYGRRMGTPVVETFTAEALPSGDFAKTINLGKLHKERGWFCVRATAARGSELLCSKATGCCVLDTVDSGSSFISANCNGAFDYLLIQAMQKIGIQRRGMIFKLSYADKAWKTNDWFVVYLKEDPFWNSPLEITGYILTDSYSYGWPQWHPSGVYPYPDEYFRELGDFVTELAKTCGNRIKTWVISEEYDASLLLARPDVRRYEAQRYIRESRIIYDALKAVNPSCTVVGLTASCSELYGPDFWEIAKNEFGSDIFSRHIDIIGPDAYCAGPYQICKSNINSIVPEDSQLRKALLATRDLQSSLGNGKNEIRISEYGYMIPYHYFEPDEEVAKRVTSLLTRYILIARSIPEISELSLYAMSGDAAYVERQNGQPSTDETPLWDCGLWRVDYDEEGAPHCSPRPWVAAVATMNKYLSDTVNPVEIHLGIPSTYGWQFTRGQCTVMVLWTSKPTPCKLEMLVPDCVKCDLMGNKQELRAGNAVLELSEYPIYILTEKPWDASGN